MEITFIGKTTFRNELRKFGIKKEDKRRHIYIIGKTGMGKTELVLNMALQDINKGYGVGFFDPHGEPAERLLELIPTKRINEVIYFNPADFEFPIAFNILERISPENRYLVSSYLVDVFKRIWVEGWTAEIEYVLGNCILALLEYPTSTLLGVYKILTDEMYRKKIIEKVTDPVVREFWLQEFPEYSVRERETIITIKNKIAQVVFNPVMRNILGQVRSKILFQEILEKKRILIVNLSRAKIGEENSKILGSFLFLKLYLALLKRIDIPPEKREDFCLYLDEFQNIIIKSLGNVLTEARKYNLSLILSHQYLAQLSEMAFPETERIKEAIFGNVGTVISFRVGAEDAEILEREFGQEFTASDFTNLPKYNMYIKLTVDGIATRPFSAISLPPVPKPKQSYKQTIIKVVRERYATPREIVEKKLSKWK